MTLLRDPGPPPCPAPEDPEISLGLLLELLRLAPVPRRDGDDPRLRRFTGRAQDQPDDRVFGGLLLAQAVVAAAHVVPERQQLVSLQGEFLAAALVEHELRWVVEPLVVGAGLSTLRSTLVGPDERPRFTATTRWGVHRDDLASYSSLAPRPAVPPEDLPSLLERFGSDPRIPLWWRMLRPVCLRHVDRPAYSEPVLPAEDHQTAWVRARGTLPGDHVLNAALLAYVSDMSLVEPFFRACGSARHRGKSRILSLSHALVLHEVPDLTDWHQFDARAHRMAGGRALGMGEYFDRGGRHVASVSQLAAVKLD